MPSFPLPSSIREPNDSALAERLIAIVRASTFLMDQLRAVRSLRLAHACIGAGAIRNLVWDTLSGFDCASALSDVDVAYFDRSDLSAERDAALTRQLQARMPEVPWEVTNQAAVHLWFESHFGHAVEPLQSLEEAIGTWPEYATSVGVWLDDQDQIHLIAPHGLTDLFQLIIRHNPLRASVQNYRDRVTQKRYDQRWPKVTVVPA